MLEGVGQAIREMGNWEVTLSTQSGTLPPRPRNSPTLDGVLGEIGRRNIKNALKLDIPVVGTQHQSLPTGIPVVAPDSVRAGRMVADYFLARGYRHLACFRTGEAWRIGASERSDAFERAAVEAGARFSCFVEGPRTQQRWALELQVADLVDWLDSLERPLGVFAIDDEHAWRLLLACQRLGAAVPEKIAVVGFGNWTSFCEFCNPRLSSVEEAPQVVGYEAARMLDRLMDGHPPPDGPVRVPPPGVVTRASSYMVATEDALVARAVQCIRDGLEDGITAADLARRLPASPSTIHRHILKALGRTPGEEIRRQRIERLCELLTQTDQPLAEIAAATGYGYISQLSRDVKKATGMPPTEYRRRFGRK